MPPPKRMTANPVKPARYRAGKPTGVESDSSDSESDAQTATASKKTGAPRKPIAPPPKAPSAGKIVSTGAASKIDFGGEEEAQRQAAARTRAEAEKRAREEGFVTEGEDEDEEGSEEEDGGSEESGSEEESESESEEEAPRRLMMRPKFIPKSARDGGGGEVKVDDRDKEEEERQAEEARRKAAADALVEEQIAKRLAARAAGKKHWEDSEEEGEEVNDEDDVDPEAEYAAWKLRELKRIRREREAIEEREREREEIERRRNLTEEERKAEDEAWIAKQKEEKDGRGKMAYLQKYFHKGAFYQDESHEQGLDRRDIMGARFADDIKNRDLLPQALQMRDMTKLGKKGATKYKDLRSEDTGRWGELDDGRQRRGFDRNLDERFQPDQDRDWRRDGGEGPKGSNAIPLGDRRGVPGAPAGPRRDLDRRDRDRESSYRLRDDDRDRRRSNSRSRSPRRDRYRDGSRERHRDRDDHRERRKRESSRDHDRYESDKRRRVDAR